MISLEFKPEKFASAVGYLAERIPNITKKQICKLLFFADKAHLLRYGRTITGDTYYALEQGPVPTKGLDALNGKGEPRNASAVTQVGHLEGWEFRLDSIPDLKILSKSDISVLDEIVAKFGKSPAWKLEELSHRDRAWKNAAQNGRMAFEDFFEDDEESQNMRQILAEEATVPAQG